MKITVGSTSIPAMMYGTAWKEEQTKSLTIQAIQSGFRSIDTANQRKHYYEAAVGEAVAEMMAQEVVSREDLFLQTKYTYQRGQDHRLPYDPQATFPEQVQQSFLSSLEHLQTSYIDSYVLHGPYSYPQFVDIDWQVWHAMEELHQENKVRFLGVSNVNSEQLRTLLSKAKVKPSFVQNRCFASAGWDYDVRQLCREHSVVYQGFSLLTANRRELQAPTIQDLCDKYQKTLPQIIFRFSIQLGMLVLTGTTNEQHMRQDLKIDDFSLTEDEVALIEKIA
ncbi:aldo/keto reductase family protein [Candidatus Uabimicrobium amorphum]|uniref:D-xylose reductase III n=1 Tax=Uabimicrobium amorphum TaxID=2596890 RepID=A0A5S9ISA4_UABAM|nr:aldo/keto reductase [Candidatus Uabimicrobium amorphum]BBM87179.1 D-xylose reductase III [Candidatus Uabimicrobium amorphum]